MKDQLIIAYIVNELEATEKARVEDWIASNDRNVDHYLELREAWINAMNTGANHNFDAQKGWNEFKYKIRAKRRNVFLKQSLTRIAGAAAAMLVLFFGLYGLIKPIASINEYHATNISDVTLPDGSKVTLNKGSTIKYPEKFLGDTREITIFGEGFFEVETDLDHPFIVKAGNFNIEVLGTSFNVKKKGEASFEVYVKSGSVLVYQRNQRSKGKKILPGDLLSLKADGSMKVSAAGRNYLCWLTKDLIFVNTPLGDVIKDMEKCYNVPIVFDSKSLKREKLTTRFTDKSLNEALEVIELIFDLRADKRSDNNIVLRTNSPPEDE